MLLFLDSGRLSYFAFTRSSFVLRRSSLRSIQLISSLDFDESPFEPFEPFEPLEPLEPLEGEVGLIFTLAPIFVESLISLSNFLRLALILALALPICSLFSFATASGACCKSVAALDEKSVKSF